MASAVSMLVGRPWIYAAAVDTLEQERLDHFTSNPQANIVFKAIMRALTLLWTGIFGAMTLLSAVSAVIRVSGHTLVATLVGTAGPIVLIGAGWKIQPRVIERIRENYANRLTTDATSELA